MTWRRQRRIKIKHDSGALVKHLHQIPYYYLENLPRSTLSRHPVLRRAWTSTAFGGIFFWTIPEAPVRLFNNHNLHDSSQAHCSARPDSCRHARDARSDHGRRPARGAPYLRARPLRLRIRPCGRPSDCGLRPLLVRRPGRSPPLRTLRRRHHLSRRACRRRIRAHGAELSRAPSRHTSHRRGHRRPQRPHARRGQDAERGEDGCAPRDLHGRRRPFGLDRRTHLASARGPH